MKPWQGRVVPLCRKPQVASVVFPDRDAGIRQQQLGLPIGCFQVLSLEPDSSEARASSEVWSFTCRDEELRPLETQRPVQDALKSVLEL